MGLGICADTIESTCEASNKLTKNRNKKVKMRARKAVDTVDKKKG